MSWKGSLKVIWCSSPRDEKDSEVLEWVERMATEL